MRVKKKKNLTFLNFSLLCMKLKKPLKVVPKQICNFIFISTRAKKSDLKKNFFIQVLKNILLPVKFDIFKKFGQT